VLFRMDIWMTIYIFVYLLIYNITRKEVCPALDFYGQSCFVRSDFFKMRCVCKTQMMPLADHKKEMKSNYMSFCEYLTKIPPPDFSVQLPVIIKYLMKIKILWDMHTSIMCINIIQNIKAVVPKL
jgi:hypothetical protein